MQRHILLVALALSISAPVWPITVVVDPNQQTRANSITANVTGADITGLIVKETYGAPFNPFTVTSVWVPTGPTSGAASVGDVHSDRIVASVSVSGNASASLAWHYSATFLSPLNSVELDGTAAGIYFDRAHSTASTPGSGPGADISFSPDLFNSSGLDDIVVTYSDAVRLKGSLTRNDLYAKLLIDFSALQPFGGLEPQDFMFTQPTDRNVAPEPMSLLLILVGLAFSVCAYTCLRSYNILK